MNEFLTNNFIYIVLVVGFIILILIGYMVDKAKTNKLKKEYEDEAKEKNEQLNIPISNVNTTGAGINTQLNNNLENNNEVK